MKSPRSQSFVIGVALALSVFNLALFALGIQWMHGFLSEVASDTEDEAVLGAKKKVDSAVSVMRAGLWSAGLLAGLFLLATVLRQWKRADHAEELSEIRSYTRNVERAKRDDGAG